MPLLADELPLCETAPTVVDQIFVDSAVMFFDVHHRHLMKCWLNKHFVATGHSTCIGLFETSLCALIEQVRSSSSQIFDAKWHLRFVNGFQLLSECDSPIRCLLQSANFAQKVVDYFAFAINKFIANTSGGLVYLEAKLLLKLVQTFSRIFGKIPPQNRSVSTPAHLIDALWTLAACDLYELDLRQASTNLIVQLESSSSPQYNSFKWRANGLIEKIVPLERQPTTKTSLQILGVGAFCSQLSPGQLGEIFEGRVLLLALLEDISVCCSSRMSTSMAIAFYRSLLSWTKAAVSTCTLRPNPIWNESNVSPIFRLFVQLIESGWDSHVEVVRDLVSEVFESLLAFFKQTTHLSKNSFLEDLVCTLLRTDWQSRLKYRPLSQISELFGPDILFGSASKVGINIPEKISLAFSDRAIAPHAATFIATVVKSASSFSASSFVEEDFLQDLIRNVVESAVGDEAVTRHFVTFVTPKLMKVRGKRFVDVIIHRASAKCNKMAMADAEYLILFSVCRSARASGLYELKDPGVIGSSGETTMTIMLNESLNHSNIHIRLEAFGFLCENVRAAQPLSNWELDTIERFIGASFKVDSSDFRQSYSSLLRKFFHRLRDSGNAETKAVGEYADFLHRITGLCLESLTFNGAAFARRSTALSLLVLIAKTFSGDSPWFSFSKNVVENRPLAIQILLRALMRDTYEDNKKMAFDLLSPFWRQCDQRIGRDAIFDEATRLSQSTHPQNGVTAAYLYKLLAMRYHGNAPDLVEFMSDTLLTNLREQLAVAKSDLSKAAVSRPIYPTVICIRYVISEFRQVLAQSVREFRDFTLQLIATLNEVANTVFPVISHQSPEGLRLNDDDENDENDEENNDDPLGLLPEFLTVCCWRSIKEVSLTLSLLVEIAIDQWDDSSKIKLLEIDEIKTIGAFFSEMLLKARHRGAFEVAYAGFDHICAKLWRCQSTDLNVLPSFWLKPLLSCFESTGDNVALSSTRRSAGLPFYFQAVVGNEPRLTRSVSVSLLETVLNLLVQRALQIEVVENESVRVHALNILRALIRDSRLEQAVSPFLGDAFVASMTALSSKHWSLRNSGTLLFSALMNRVFGVHRDKFTPATKNRMTGRLFFAIYPNLFQYLLNFFGSKNEAPSSVAVTFLSLFEHLYPSPFDVNENGNNGDQEVQVNVFAFIPALISLLKSRSVRVRIMSARSIRNFIAVDSLPVLLESVLNEINNSTSWVPNFIDGCFILLRKLVVMFESDKEAFEIIQDVSFALVNSVRENSFVTANILHLFIKMIEIQDSDRLISTSLDLAGKVVEQSKGPSTLLIRAVQCSILAMSRKPLGIGETLEKYLRHQNKFVRSATVDCLNEILLSQFLKKERGSLIASLFEGSIGKDEEYVKVDFRNDIPLANDRLFQLVWQQINTLDLADFEMSKMLTLFSFCVLLNADLVENSMAEKVFEKLVEIISLFGHLSEIALPCSRALAAVAPFLSEKSQNRVVDIFSKTVVSTDDLAKFRVVIFGLCRLPKETILQNDAACDVMVTLMTSSEPEIRVLASWYVTRNLCPDELRHSALHSGMALVVFISLVVASRPVSNAVEWLLTVATTPKRMLTTGGENIQLVFEAEETNPFAEDRLISNICALLISILLNGVEETLKKVFPQIRLSIPLIRCFEYFFRKEVDVDQLLPIIQKFQLIGVESSILGRNQVADAIFQSILPTKYGDEEFAQLMRRLFSVQAVMPRSDVTYQRLLICKSLNNQQNIEFFCENNINQDAFLLGDSALDTMLIC